MAQGCAGRYLSVDLTKGRCSDFVIDDRLHGKFIGGKLAGSEAVALSHDELGERLYAT